MVNEKQTQMGTALPRKTRFSVRQVFVQLIIAVLILVSGVIIGSGGTILLVKYKMPWLGHSPKKSATSIAEMIKDKYSLSEEQTRQVENIVKEAFLKKDSIRQERDKELEAVRKIMVTEMEKVLTPEQFEKWYKDFQIRREKFKK